MEVSWRWSRIIPMLIVLSQPQFSVYESREAYLIGYSGMKNRKYVDLWEEDQGYKTPWLTKNSPTNIG